MRAAGRLALAAVAVPIAAKALRKVGQSMQDRESMQHRQGGSRMGGMMQKAGSRLDKPKRRLQRRLQTSRYF